VRFLESHNRVCAQNPESLSTLGLARMERLQGTLKISVLGFSKRTFRTPLEPLDSILVIS
jgi:hypothetical protein